MFYYTQRKKLLRIRFADSHICKILSCQTGLKDFCLLLSFRKKLRKRNPPSKEGLGFLPFFKERQRYPDYPVNPVLFEHIL